VLETIEVVIKVHSRWGLPCISHIFET